MRNGNLINWDSSLTAIPVLIVPCGMETRMIFAALNLFDCINCTLRNGNIESRRVVAPYDRVLIVPCGMETETN